MTTITTEFAGRVAVVTGGSDGLGADFCRALCAAGCEVYFCARNVARGRRAARGFGPNAHFIRADVARPAQITGFANRVRQSAGRVDYLINNVAVDDRVAFKDVTPSACDRMWQVNLRSYLLTTHAFLELLHAGVGKSIVNIGTNNNLIGKQPFTIYNATKAGSIGFTRSLACELGPAGIRVNMVSPGWVMTRKQLRAHVTPSDKRELLRDQALKFLLQPEHITPAVLFLLGSGARAITGQNLVVDAGEIMQ